MANLPAFFLRTGHVPEAVQEKIAGIDVHERQFTLAAEETDDRVGHL